MLESCILKMLVATNAVFFLFLADTEEVKCVSGRVLAKVETRAGFEHVVLGVFLSFCLFSGRSPLLPALNSSPVWLIGKMCNRTQLP